MEIRNALRHETNVRLQAFDEIHIHLRTKGIEFKRGVEIIEMVDPNPNSVDQDGEPTSFSLSDANLIAFVIANVSGLLIGRANKVSDYAIFVLYPVK